MMITMIMMQARSTTEEMMTYTLRVYLGLTGNIGDIFLTTRPIFYLSGMKLEGS
jgi:hypothetical protein